MTKLKKKTTQKGDTLIEVVFALLIIGVIVAVALQGAIKAHRSAVAARQRTEATLIAQSQAEMFRAYRNYLGHWDDSVGTPSLFSSLWGGGPPAGTNILDGSSITRNAGGDAIGPMCNKDSGAGDYSQSFFTYVNASLIYNIHSGYFNQDTANPPNRPTDVNPPTDFIDILLAGVSQYNVETRINCTDFNASNRDIIHYLTKVTWTDTQNQDATLELHNYITQNAPDF